MKKIVSDELKRLTIEEFKTADKLPVIVIADNIRSLHNIGSMFRSGDAFGIEAIVLCGITATPPNREIHKTALGAELSVRWEWEKSTLAAVKKVKKSGYRIIAVEQVENAVMLNEFKPLPQQKYALVFGNEVAGVTQEVVDICDHYIEIPQVGTKHSLNVSVACGVVLWHFFQESK